MKSGFVNIIDPVSDGVYIYKFHLQDHVSIESFLIAKGFEVDKVKYIITDSIKLIINEK